MTVDLAADVIVVGGGTAGTVVAHRLVRAGAHVMPLEQEAPGHGDSQPQLGQVGGGPQPFGDRCGVCQPRPGQALPQAVGLEISGSVADLRVCRRAVMVIGQDRRSCAGPGSMP